jgi:hypothetical protein
MRIIDLQIHQIFRNVKPCFARHSPHIVRRYFHRYSVLASPKFSQIGAGPLGKRFSPDYLPLHAGVLRQEASLFHLVGMIEELEYTAHNSSGVVILDHPHRKRAFSGGNDGDPQVSCSEGFAPMFIPFWRQR